MTTPAPHTRYEEVRGRLPGDRALRLRSRHRSQTLLSQIARQIRSHFTGSDRANAGPAGTIISR